jgi:hypothetical protein
MQKGQEIHLKSRWRHLCLKIPILVMYTECQIIVLLEARALQFNANSKARNALRPLTKHSLYPQEKVLLSPRLRQKYFHDSCLSV